MFQRKVCLGVLLTGFALVAAGSSAAEAVDRSKVPGLALRRAAAAAPRAVLPPPLLAPAQLLDDFNRADGPLGGNWLVREGGAWIASNAARANGLGATTFVGGSGLAVEADVAVLSSNDDYVALILDYADNDNNLYLKVQQQGGAGFDHAACYYGNNGGSFGLGFFTLDASFTTAHMRAERSGSTVTVTFSNIDGGGGSQVYTCTGAPATGGTGIGIGGWEGQDASLDNFAADAAEIGEPIPVASPLGLVSFAGLLALLGCGWLLRRR